MLARIAGAVRFKEPLSFHTSLRLGGPAEFFVVPRDLEDVRYALDFADREDLPVIVIGGGNNMLVSDCGVQAVVLKLQGVLARAEFDGDRSEARVPAAPGDPLAHFARERVQALQHLFGWRIGRLARYQRLGGGARRRFVF